MSKFIFQVIFALCVCLAVGNAAVAMERRHPNSGPNSCISKSYGLNMRAGEALSVPGVCMQAMCKTNGDIVYYSCGVVAIRPGCKIVQADPNLPYPDCCSTKVVCY